MTIEELTSKVVKVSDGYAKKCHIVRDDDWYLLKIQEELGELTQQHLKLSKRGRVSDGVDHRKLLEDELSDVLSHVLLYADKFNIDLKEAVERKWLRWLD